MGVQIRLTQQNEERLKKINTNLNTAIEMLWEEYRGEKQFKEGKDRIVEYFKVNYAEILEENRLTARQELHVKALIQEALEEARQGNY